MKLKAIVSLFKETIREWQEDKTSRLAAALAYYTVFSLAPLLIIAIAIAGAIFGEEAARGEIVGQIQGLVGLEGAKVIEAAIENANKPDVSSVASLLSVIALLFGASGVFAQLQDALNTVWEVQSKPGGGIGGFIRKRVLSFSAVFGIGFLLLVSLVVSAVLAGLNKYLSSLVPGIDALWQILNFGISFGVITLLFALMYKYLPDVRIKWSDVWIGAAITALLFAIGKFALGLYLGRGSFGSTYGAAGSLVVLLAWVYYSAQILFFGAEFTQVYARRYGSNIVPDEHAVRLTEEARSKQGMTRNSRRRDR
ncbi:YihY/virulence factor BrkB family protein [Lusitaniella coriacea LEGE 07157]|uniref:YihY/virulence factor BrkB family protein n=1 Tax=Lusitaniella coriacea LEGE 07157 TaxID=945747 RepID=A0A8J7E2A1_9CYAN|nr:YihY/virulence factor BrkB family protein [Lusitaniella coriacea]MBE9118707.1 YihY/virulence factor BrkB family protein [Lusitaniella coriacea LEGE 07157]